MKASTNKTKHLKFNEFSKYLTHKSESRQNKVASTYQRNTLNEWNSQIPPRPVMKNAEVQVNDITHIAKLIKMVTNGELVWKCWQKEKDISEFI